MWVRVSKEEFEPLQSSETFTELLHLPARLTTVQVQRVCYFGGSRRGEGILLVICTSFHLSEAACRRMLWCLKPDHAGLDKNCYRIIKPKKNQSKGDLCIYI